MRAFVTIGLLSSLLVLSFLQSKAQSSSSAEAILLSQFTSATIEIDGEADRAWEEAKSYLIEKAVVADLSRPAVDCQTRGVVRSLWDGADGIQDGYRLR